MADVSIHGAPVVDLTSPAFAADPAGYAASAREAGDGVHYQDDIGAWAVLRYDDVLAVLRDTSRFHSAWYGRVGAERPVDAGQAAAVMKGNLLFQDPPVHTRLRALISRAFTPRAVEGVRAAVERRAAELLADIGPGDEVDLVERLAAPLPIDAIAEMLAVPAGDRTRFLRWSDAAALLLAPGLTDEQRRVVRHDTGAFVAYLREVIEERRRAPGDDLLSALLVAEVEGERLRAGEVVHLVQLLLVAGNETTRSLLASAAALIVARPDDRRRLRAAPDEVGSFVEEVLRWEPPVTCTFRVTTEPIRFGETEVPAHEPVMAVLPSANRDPRAFEEPDAFVLTRTPNKHVGFGFGLHHCLGAALARMEAAVALPLLLERMGEPSFLAPASYSVTGLTRGLATLRVTL